MNNCLPCLRVGSGALDGGFWFQGGPRACRFMLSGQAWKEGTPGRAVDRMMRAGWWSVLAAFPILLPVLVSQSLLQ
jgi:hypothetical protein